MSDSYTEKLADLSDKSDDDLKTLETDFVKDFDKADEADDLDSLAASADAIDAVRAEQERREKETAKAAKAEKDDKTDEAKSEERPAPKKEPVAAAATEPEPDAEEDGEDEDDADADAKDGEAKKDDKSEVKDKTEPVAASASPDDQPEQPASGQAEAVDNPPEADESADAGAADEGGVQASGKQQGQEDSQVDIPEDRKPVATASPATTVVAGADIPGFGAGTEFTNLNEVNDAFLARLNSVKRARGGDGEQHVVASVKADIPEDRMLAPGDIEGNSRKIEAVTGLPAIVAAGGFCAPLAVRYDIFGLGSTRRPIKESLPGFGATRGGIRFVTPPKLGDDAAAVGLWSASEDSTASAIATITNKALTSNVATLTTSVAHGYVVGQSVKVSGVGAPFDGTWVVSAVTSTTFSYADTAANVGTAASGGTSQQIKPTLRVACAAELTATVDAITLSLIFGNLMSRAFPELVARHNDLALIQQARFAEINLLNQLSAASTAVTSAFKIGTARDFLLAVGRAAAAYRNRHRVARDTPLRVVAPEWVLDAMREDLTQGLPGDKLTAADAEINKYFSDRSVNVTWHMDDVIAVQGAGAIVDFPATFKWFIFAEGTFLLLDGGTLDLGIVRDSGLVGTNDYMVFVEIFEALAKVGIESVAVTTTSHVSGSVVGTTAPA